MNLIWDWNGTLLDDVEINCAIMNEMLVRRGLPPLESLARYREIFQFPVENYYREAGLDFEKESFAEMAAEYIALYPIKSKDCTLMPGAREALEALRAAGCTQHILSASESSLLETQLKRLGIRDYFTHIIGQDDAYAVGKTKRGLLWMQKEHIAPESCLLIGDTDHDAQTAEALGCRAVLLACGHQSRGHLEHCGVPVFDTLAEAVRAVLHESHGIFL